MRFRLAHKIASAAILASSCLFALPGTAQTQSDNYPASNNSIPQFQTQPQSSDNKRPGTYTPQSQADSNNSRKDYANKIRETYNFRFGEGNISTPGNAKVVGNDFVQPGAFPSAKYCSKCHQEAYSQWRQALHSNSFRTPFYRTSVNI